MGATSRRLLPRLVHSFTLKLILLALVLLSVPPLLYWQFARAEEEQLALMGNAVVQTNHVLAAMLRSHFEKFASEPAGDMQQALKRAAVGDTRVKILVRLQGRQDFSYVAAVPAVTVLPDPLSAIVSLPAPATIVSDPLPATMVLLPEPTVILLPVPDS